MRAILLLAAAIGLSTAAPDPFLPQLSLAKLGLEEATAAEEAGGAPLQCDLGDLARCTAKWASNYGYPAGLPSNPSGLIANWSRAAFSSSAGFAATCRLLGSYQRCVGVSFPACLSLYPFMAITPGLTAVNARRFLVFVDQMDYQCGPGYAVIQNNFQCLLRSGRQASAALQQCAATLFQQLGQPQVDECAAYNAYFHCSGMIFAVQCGNNLGWAMCSSYKNGLARLIPQCRLSCQGILGSGSSNSDGAVIHPSATLTHLRLPFLIHPEEDPSPVDLPSCDTSKFRTCTKSFDKVIGFTGTSVQEFAEYVSKYIGQDLHNFGAFCRAWESYESCNGAQFGPCTTVASLESMGLSARDAAEAHAIAAQFAVECSSKVASVIEAHRACIVRINRGSEPKVQDCLETFQKELGTKGKCPAVQDFVTCISGIFRPCGDDVVAAICQIERAGLVASFGECSVNCPAGEVERLVLPNVPLDPRLFAEEIPGEVAEAEPGQCDKAKFLAALAAFNKAIGFTGHGAQEFIAYLQAYVKKDPKNFLNVCKAGATMTATLGSEKETCFSVPNLESELGYSVQDAYAIHGVDAVLSFECRPDILKELEEHGKCIDEYNKKGAEKLKECVATFQKEIQSKGLCPADQDYVGCVSHIYAPCGRVTEHLMCQIMQVSMHASIPQCQPVCHSFAPSPLLGVDSLPLPLATLDLKLPENSVAEPDSCNKANFVAALAAFNKAIGFSGHGVDAFIAYLQAYVKKDPKNFLNVCKAGAALASALGADKETCFSIPNLESELGESVEDAYKMHSLDAVLSFECRPDILQQLEKYGKCIEEYNVKGARKMAACQSTFQAEIHSKGLCPAAQDFINCDSHVFAPCGRSAERLMCQIFQVSIHSSIPQCQTVCRLSTPAEAPVGLGMDPLINRLAPLSELVRERIPRAAEAGVAEPVPCQPSDISRCAEQLFHAVGFNGSSVVEFQRYLVCWFAEAPDNFAKMCKAEAGLNTCLDGETCWTPGVLESVTGLDKTDADMARALHAVFDYECQPEVLKALGQFGPCLQAANKDRRFQRSLRGCERELRSGKPLCKALDAYDACASGLYARRCGDKLGPLMCDVFRHGSAANAPQCQLHC